MSKSWYNPQTGALVCDEEVDGVTQLLSPGQEKEYGAKYFVGETIKESAAGIISKHLGLEYQGPMRRRNIWPCLAST